MDIIGTILKHNTDADLDPAELKRLGLDKQAKTIFVDHKDERDDYPVYLFGDGSLMLNFPDQAAVMLDRKETARLFTFLKSPHVQEALYRILRASLIESSREGAELIAKLDRLTPKQKRMLVEAFHGPAAA
jgi:hypothetical protein